jgi:hypothetical protein
MWPRARKGKSTTCSSAGTMIFCRHVDSLPVRRMEGANARNVPTGGVLPTQTIDRNWITVLAVRELEDRAEA